MATFQKELFTDYIDDALPLLLDHWSELALYQDKVPLNIDYEKYQQLEDLGVLHIYTAREEGYLVGYCVMMVNTNLHYKDHKYALNDVIYVDPRSRNKGLGRDLIQFTEEELGKEGVSVVMINTKNHRPFDGLLEKEGYILQDKLFSKYIGV